MRKIWIGYAAAIAAVAACTAGGRNNPLGSGGTGGGSTNTPTFTFGGGSPTSTTVTTPAAVLEDCNGQCTDFPADVINDAKSPPNASDLALFTGTGTGTAPCLIEPQPGTLVPNNWVRPYIQWAVPAGTTTVEVTLTADNQAGKLVAYTSSLKGWFMDADVWANLRKHTFNAPITVSVRAIVNGQLSAAATGDITIATVNAVGSIVYWATNGNADSWKTDPEGSYLQGFKVGEEGYTKVLLPSQVQMPVYATPGDNFGDWGKKTSPVKCIGCHVSTPDGQYAAFVAQFADPVAIASVQGDGGVAVGAKPTWLSQAGYDALNPWPRGQGWPGDQTAATYGLGTVSFSPKFWSDTNKLMIASKGNDLAQYGQQLTGAGHTAELVWVDLLATSNATGIISRTGDTRSAATPNWSHSGDTIVYTSTNVKNSERLGCNPGFTCAVSSPVADLYTVPFDGASKSGGLATPVPGASAADKSEYYPAFSADDQLIAYNVTDAGLDLYNQPAAQVYVIPKAGGTGIRITGNDPAVCTGKKSPGVNNSWPKWSPEVLEDPRTTGRKFYWVTFSSSRDVNNGIQIYLAGITLEPDGTYKTYPAVMFWNQDPTMHNHTPAWDVFAIKQADIVPPPR